VRYLALASDYDGTLALHGKVDANTVVALESLRESGRKLILVTGRELDELLGIFPEVRLFDLVVAENGALLYNPSNGEEKLLAEKPPPEFVAELQKRGVGPISVGRCIVATWEPHETTCLKTIRDLALELEIIFNKGAVMILPTGVNKATGLIAACEQLGISPHNVVGSGDAENDHAFLSICECSVAVSNALDALKTRSDVVTEKDHGAGVTEIINEMISNDLASMEDRLTRHYIPLGTAQGGPTLSLRPYGTNIMLAGPSASGKSTVATGVMERLMELGYQLIVVDPEGDYESLEGALTLGSANHTPTIDEVMELLGSPRQNVVVNLVGLPLDDRPAFFLALMPRLQELRTRTGRPHWIAVDEAHHVLPVLWEPAALTMPVSIDRMLFITVHPAEVSPVALSAVDTVIAVGKQPDRTIAEMLEATRTPSPRLDPVVLERGEVLYYSVREGGVPTRVTAIPGKSTRRRHLKKYAEGDLGADSFYFRGPESKLNLQAQNLVLFMQIADGVDDETWQFHLIQGDYSRWVREAIKDTALASEVEAVEQRKGLPAADSRAMIREAIQRHYTQPVSTPASALAHVVRPA
jgi:hydroxymethylpyrimidine pyrophosphatase-like HAD family hydrolase